MGQSLSPNLCTTGHYHCKIQETITFQAPKVGAEKESFLFFLIVFSEQNIKDSLIPSPSLYCQTCFCLTSDSRWLWECKRPRRKELLRPPWDHKQITNILQKMRALGFCLSWVCSVYEAPYHLCLIATVVPGNCICGVLCRFQSILFPLSGVLQCLRCALHFWWYSYIVNNE